MPKWPLSISLVPISTATGTTQSHPDEIVCLFSNEPLQRGLRRFGNLVRVMQSLALGPQVAFLEAADTAANRISECRFSASGQAAPSAGALRSWGQTAMAPPTARAEDVITLHRLSAALASEAVTEAVAKLRIGYGLVAMVWFLDVYTQFSTARGDQCQQRKNLAPNRKSSRRVIWTGDPCETNTILTSMVEANAFTLKGWGRLASLC
jgi:hypothetical protein